MGFAQEDCIEIDDDASRLACYDKSLGRQQATATENDIEDIEADTGNWDVRIDTSQMTDETNVFVSLSSNDIAYCSWGSEPVRLLLRCLENTTAAMFITSCHVTSGHGGYGRITYRVDDRKPVMRSFEASTDNRALGLWSYRRARPFIDQLMGGNRLIMRFTPYSESPREVEFDISGIDEAIKPLRETCGW